MSERCEFPQWSCSVENNESNSWTVPAGSEAGMTNATVEIQWLCCSTPVSVPTAQPQWGYWLMFVSQGGLSSHREHREWFGCGRYRQGGVKEWWGLPVSSLLWEVKDSSGVIKSLGMKSWQPRHVFKKHCLSTPGSIFVSIHRSGRFS